MRTAQPRCQPKKCTYRPRKDGRMVCTKCHHHQSADDNGKILPDRMVVVSLRVPVWLRDKIKTRAKKEGVPYTNLMLERIMELRGAGKPKKNEVLGLKELPKTISGQ